MKLTLLAATLSISTAAFAQEGEPAQPAERPIQPAERPAQPAERPARAVSQPGEVDPAAKEKLEAAAAKIKAAPGLSYTGKVFAEGSMIADVAPVAEGQVLMLREAGEGAGGRPRWWVRVQGAGKPKPREAQRDLDVTWSPDWVRYIDPDAKKVHQRPGGRSVASPVIRAAEGLRSSELLDAEPFRKFLTARNITFDAPADVAGEMCDVVVTSQGSGPKEKVYLSQGDGLPRKIERVYNSASMQGSFTLELRDMKVREDLNAEQFIQGVPEGFTEEKLEAAAPAQRPAQGGARESLNLPRVGANAAPALAMAENFELSTPEGTKVSLASLKGSVVLLDFWGTWCLPCRASHKELQAAADQFKGQPVRVLSIAVNEKNDQAPAEYMRKNGYTFDVLLRGDETAKAYNVKAYPTFLVVDQEGRIVHRADGYERGKTIPEVSAAISRALGSGTTPAPDAAAAPATPTGAEETPTGAEGK